MLWNSAAQLLLLQIQFNHWYAIFNGHTKKYRYPIVLGLEAQNGIFQETKRQAV